MNDIYEFSFERSRLTKLVAGLLSLVALVFFAGVLTGLVLWSGGPAPALVAKTDEPLPKAAPAPVVPAAVSPIAESSTAAITPEVDEDDEPAVEPDVPAVVVEQTVSETHKAPAVHTTDAIPAGSFALQLGAFRQPDNAGVLARQLAAQGFNADVVKRADSKGHTWYLVRYGTFSNRAEASAAALELRSQSNLDALVRPANSM